MTNYREILRLQGLGLNKSQIVQSLDCSRTTVIQVLNIAKEKGICYPLPEDLSDRKLPELLFPSVQTRNKNAELRVRSQGTAEKLCRTESLVARILREVPRKRRTAVPGWREKIGDPILADAICDRIVHDSYSIVIDCKESMCKRKGVKENNV